MTNGYQVYTNVKDETEQAIKGTVPLMEDLDILLVLRKCSHAGISLRSGICDLLSEIAANIL